MREDIKFSSSIEQEPDSLVDPDPMFIIPFIITMIAAAIMTANMNKVGVEELEEPGNEEERKTARKDLLLLYSEIDLDYERAEHALNDIELIIRAGDKNDSLLSEAPAEFGSYELLLTKKDYKEYKKRCRILADCLKRFVQNSFKTEELLAKGGLQLPLQIYTPIEVLQSHLNHVQVNKSDYYMKFKELNILLKEAKQINEMLKASLEESDTTRGDTTL